MRKTSTYKNEHLHSRNTGVQKYYCPSNGFKWKFYCEYKETFFSKMGPKFYILFTSMLPFKNSLLIYEPDNDLSLSGFSVGIVSTQHNTKL